MKLSVKAFATSAAILWGGSIFLVASLHYFFPGYGQSFLEIPASFFPGYHVDRSIVSVLIGTGWGLVDGAIDGAIFAFLYNVIAGSGAGGT